VGDAGRKHNWSGILLRLLQFRLRSLLFFALLLAAFIAWIGEDLIRTRIQRPIVAKIIAAGGDVYFDYQVSPDGMRLDAFPPGSLAVRSLFGDDIYATAIAVTFYGRQTTDDDVESLHKLPGLLDVVLTGPGVTDKCVDDLLRISQLRQKAWRNLPHQGLCGS